MQRCQLITRQGLAVPGWVTAHGRSEPSQPSGYVFKDCSLTGFSKVYLGRAWGRYSRVIFFNTFMSDIVMPQGWDSWHTPDHGFVISFSLHLHNFMVFFFHFSVIYLYIYD